MNQNLKKIIYLTLSIFLGFLISVIFHSILEIYLIEQSSHPEFLELTGRSCYLPNYLNIGLSLFGLIGGFFLGLYWWKKIYIKNNEKDK